MSERFRPPSHVRPDTPARALEFAARLLVDLQFRSIHRDMKRFLPTVTGTVLDVGAGQSPFRHLVPQERARYVGLDIEGAGAFGYNNPSVERFDGTNIPHAEASVDHVICTEVLEHAEHPDRLVREIHRVMKPGGTALVTIPWSARFHYIPHDFQRLTPTALRALFSDFSSVRVSERGTDLTAIASKVVVVYARLLVPRRKLALAITLPTAIVLSPALLLSLLLGHLSLGLEIGSPDDPLGYTIRVTK